MFGLEHCRQPRFDVLPGARCEIVETRRVRWQSIHFERVRASSIPVRPPIHPFYRPIFPVPRITYSTYRRDARHLTHAFR